MSKESHKFNKKGNLLTFIIGLLSIIKLFLDAMEYKVLIDETINSISNFFASIGAIVGIILNHELRFPRR